ncbi:alpha/beta fold hydrolase [Aliiruegeria lutimaris]|uniref:Pimeloyl-ACP methyl ester carboxylesterase n=1 Tax=Aliiruegeria lutimaris TaxID=571298 RepID=A0A1G9GW03_9RHOB|nr:alpha/beta hydrolase [Aliiruegeria lutimaris]SDL04846.1 Pimeloyl-ACP methyl ester carboxylesterase [Aliiruegeria lutimaris]
MRSKFVDLNGVRLNYGEGAANGSSLVFLPGFPRYWSEYQPMLEELEPHYHVFALSMRGQGQSQWSPPYRISDYIEDTVAFLREVVGPSSYGVAHSAGAWFGLAAANDFPDLFSAFVSIDQPLDPDDHIIAHGTDTSSVKTMLTAMRVATGVDDLALKLRGVPTSDGRTWADEMSGEDIRARAVHLSGIDPETFAPWADGLESWIGVPALQRWPGQYRAPLMFLDGDPEAGSMLTSKSVSYNMARYPWAKRVELQHHDHVMGLRDAPEPAVAEIRRFLDGIP